MVENGTVPPIAPWSAILTCMSRTAQKATDCDELFIAEKGYDGDAGQVRPLEHIYKHSLLDSGILCCLVHILNVLLDPDEANQKQKATDRDELFTTEKDYDGDAGQVCRLEMVANGSLIVFSRHKEGPVLLHSIQLHRHAMQILVLLLVNGNRSTAKHIRKHHLIKVLLMAVKDFNPDCGDSTYTMGIVNLLLEYVEVSCRPAGRSWWCLA